MNDIEKAFRGLGRTKKVEFISEKIDYASAHAVAGYVSSYLFEFSTHFRKYFLVVLPAKSYA